MLRIQPAKSLELLKKAQASNACYAPIPCLLNKGLGILKYFVQDLIYARVKEKTHQSEEQETEN